MLEKRRKLTRSGSKASRVKGWRQSDAKSAFGVAIGVAKRGKLY